MTTFMRSLKRILAELLVAAMLSAPGAVFADTGYYLIPWLSIDERYDDNLFYSSSDQVSDFITRLSPLLQAGYESANLNWLASYGIDADYYHQQSELNSSHARQQARAEIQYRPNRRWTLAGEAEYLKTDTPADLTFVPGVEIPGLLLGRNPAERTYLRPITTYQFAANKTGSLAYTLIDDKLIGVTETYTQAVEVDLKHQLSAANMLTYGYFFRHYRFKDETGTTTFDNTSMSTNTPWLGVSRDFSPTTKLGVRAGPIISSGSTKAYVLLSLQHTYSRGELLANYVHDEITLLGEDGPLDSHSLDMSLTHRLGADLELGVSAGLAKVSRPEFSAKIASLALEARYKVRSFLFITTSYRYNTQKTDGIDSAQDRVNHGVFQLGLTFTRPRPYTTTRPN